jgi:hypothetical protein
MLSKQIIADMGGKYAANIQASRASAVAELLLSYGHLDCSKHGQCL